MHYAREEKCIAVGSTVIFFLYPSMPPGGWIFWIRYDIFELGSFIYIDAGFSDHFENWKSPRVQALFFIHGYCQLEKNEEKLFFAYLRKCVVRSWDLYVNNDGCSMIRWLIYGWIQLTSGSIISLEKKKDHTTQHQNCHWPLSGKKFVEVLANQVDTLDTYIENIPTFVLIFCKTRKKKKLVWLLSLI